jgi:hypothetical protein
MLSLEMCLIDGDWRLGIGEWEMGNGKWKWGMGNASQSIFQSILPSYFSAGKIGIIGKRGNRTGSGSHTHSISKRIQE